MQEAFNIRMQPLNYMTDGGTPFLDNNTPCSVTWWMAWTSSIRSLRCLRQRATHEPMSAAMEVIDKMGLKEQLAQWTAEVAAVQLTTADEVEAFRIQWLGRKGK